MSSYTKVEFIVRGVPEPHPRPRARVVKGKAPFAQMYTPADGPARRWQRAVAAAVRLAYRGPAFVGPVSATITIYGERPKRLCRKRDDPSPRPMDARGSGDCDNYAKGVLDALEGVMFENDAQVTRLTTEKWYAAVGDQPHARVVLWGVPGSGGQR